jgi:hypothetical protein
VKEIGDPIDFSDRSMTCLFNCKEMWWSSRIPDQQKIFDELLANKNNRHRGSIAEQEAFLDFEFNPTEEGSIKNRKSSKRAGSKSGKYELFIDPFDNQGHKRAFSLSGGK